LRSFFLSASYCNFTNLGDANNPAIEAYYVCTSSNITNPPFTISNCTIDSCGELPYVGIIDGAVNFQLTNDTWINPLAASVLVAAASVPLSGAGTRLINSCVFLGEPDFSSPSGFTITNNYFSDILYGGKTQPQWAEFDGNFILQPTANEIQMAGNVTNCFVLGNPSSPTQQLLGLFMSAYASSEVTGSVFETTATASGGLAISQTEGGVADRTTTISYNIILPNGAGGQTGVVAYMATNITDTNWPTAVVQHNTVFVGNSSAALAGTGVKPEMTGFIQSFSSNIFWSNSVNAGSYALAENYSNPTAYPDPVAGANADYNAWYNLSTVPSGTWTAPYNAGNGTVYDVPLSAAPGVHDKANVNPNFINSAVNFLTWDASVGGPGTVADGLARIEQNPSLTESSLLPYIRAGYAPTNSVLQGAAADGTYIGAVPVNSATSGVVLPASATPAPMVALSTPSSGPTVEASAQPAVFAGLSIDPTPQAANSTGLTAASTTQVATASSSAARGSSTPARVTPTVITAGRSAQDRAPAGDVVFQLYTRKNKRVPGQSGHETGAKLDI
jgi:hypothetical protein